MAQIVEEEHLHPSERGFARVQVKREHDAHAPHMGDDEIVAAAHAKLLKTFKSGHTRSYEWRMTQLKGMRALLAEQKDRMTEAVAKDLGRAQMEGFLGDVASTLGEVDFAMANLQSWMKPEAVSTPMMQKPGHSAIVKEPKGVILIIAPWNFPLHLSMLPVAQAFAAGNCVLLKPSEVAGNCEKFLAEWMPKYLDPDALAVVTGGVPETTALLKLRWDHILYTGNSVVARIVCKAAAEHLTPVTLELGGKTPTVVLPGADIPLAVKRILVGKCFNAGQICIAPDYLLIHESLEQQFVEEAQKTLRAWYGEDASASPDYGRIINEGHFRRVKALVESSDGELLPRQGVPDQASKFIPPTLIRGPSLSSPVMQEEIFGPVLPVLKMRNVEDIINHINAGDKPLALYIFGPEKDAQELIARTSSGGVCVNDTIMHIGNPNLPFGGVGNSGTGAYHGKFGFDEFSHHRGVMYKGTWMDASQRYPPYTEANQRMMEKLMIGPLIPPAVKSALAAVFAIAVALVVRYSL